MRLVEFFSDLKQGQKEFGEDIAVIINSILLTMAYIFGIGFSFLISKLVNKNFLDVRIDKNKKTYWEDLNLDRQELNSYYKQF